VRAGAQAAAPCSDPLQTVSDHPPQGGVNMRHCLTDAREAR
jgi:hypothetical protein